MEGSGGPHTSGRWALLCALVTAALAVPVPSAPAATYDYRTGASPAADILVYDGAAGERNVVALTTGWGQFRPTYRVTVADPGAGTISPLPEDALAPAPLLHCLTAPAAHQLACETGTIGPSIRVAVELGGGADVLRAHGRRTIDLDVRGGSSPDRLFGAQSARNDSFQRLAGNGGGDLLSAGRGNSFLDGGAGDDSITGGPEFDAVDAGAGDDDVDTRDARRDFVDCGPGDDAVRVDPQDELSGCELIEL